MAPVASTNPPNARTPLTLGPGSVWLGSDDETITPVVARLRAPAQGPVARPRWEVVDRPGTVGLTAFTGREPFEVVLPIMLDAYPDGSVESDLTRLSVLAIGSVDTWKDDQHPPILRVLGPVPWSGSEGRRWVITSVEEVGRTLFNTAGERCRWAGDITLLEHIADDLLAESLNRNRKGQRGIATHKTHARAGETLYDVARRVYHDPSRASDIARANSVKGVPLRLGVRFTAPRALRLP